MNNIEENIKVLEKLQEDQDKRLVSEEEKFETHSKLDLLYARKASMLRQKSRIKWSIEGDKNTRFFHHCVQKEEQ